MILAAEIRFLQKYHSFHIWKVHLWFLPLQELRNEISEEYRKKAEKVALVEQYRQNKDRKFF